MYVKDIKKKKKMFEDIGENRKNWENNSDKKE